MSFGSKVSRALRFLEIPVKDRASVSFLKNPDLQPIKSVNQTWGFWSNFAYWGVMSFSVGTWMSASAALGVGLSYPETIGTFIVGDVLTIIFTLANSCPGYDWKVGFTLAQRFVFGIYGSAFGIIIRILMSIVNYGSNAWLGGLCINMIDHMRKKNFDFFYDDEKVEMESTVFGVIFNTFVSQNRDLKSLWSDTQTIDH